MIIALVTEFPQDKYFQWRMGWDEERQRKFNVFVKSVKITPEALSLFPLDHGYWEWIRKADLVFVYCSRTARGFYNDKFWEWFKLPVIARSLMRPDAKLVAQWDQEFIWIFHPDWSWWSDKIPMQAPPEEFFKATNVLNVADAHLTVLKYPLFQKFSPVPSYYLPLPQLLRYKSYSYGLKARRVALLNHTSISGSINHTAKNVVRKLMLPTTIFNSLSFHKPYSGKIWCANHGLPQGSVSYGRLDRDPYMETLNKCYMAIDDQEKYIGWSRFVMECALAFVPCIGSNFANKIFFPDLYTKHKDYPRQRELVNKLLKNPTWHKKIAEKGFVKVIEHMDTDRLCQRLLTIGKELDCPDTKIDIEEMLFLEFLSRQLPNHLPSIRPKSGTVFDYSAKRSLTPEEWDEYYGKWKEYLVDDAIRQKYIERALKWMRNHWVII